MSSMPTCHSCLRSTLASIFAVRTKKVTCTVPAVGQTLHEDFPAQSGEVLSGRPCHVKQCSAIVEQPYKGTTTIFKSSICKTQYGNSLTTLEIIIILTICITSTPSDGSAYVSNGQSWETWHVLCQLQGRV